MQLQLGARQVSCLRGRRMLFEGVDVDLRAGQALRVAGPNGSGKSSLLRILCGLALPHAGEVTWQGEGIGVQRAAYARKLLYLGHAPAIKEELSAVENLAFDCALAEVDADGAAVRKALADAGVGKLADMACRQLSEGQRKRVALARLHLARERSLWVLDEPFSALDAAATAALTGLMKAHLARGGLMVYTTHQEAALAPHVTLVLG
ncbi:MAG: cytochrome c biogenesis heme-transporting ATPase CcmA [Massilia sp.]